MLYHGTFWATNEHVVLKMMVKRSDVYIAILGYSTPKCYWEVISSRAELHFCMWGTKAGSHGLIQQRSFCSSDKEVIAGSDGKEGFLLHRVGGQVCECITS